MTAMSFIPGFSNLKKNAKTNTNANVEDLHSATHNQHTSTPRKEGDTVESKSNKF